MNSCNPHVVLILLDAVRANCLSCYGYERRTTPNMDALADDGIRFANAFSPGPNTVLGHAALFTGLSYHNGVRTALGSTLRPEVPTIAETFRDNGYETTCISRNPWISDEYGFTRGFTRTVDLWRNSKVGRQVGRIGKAFGYGDKGAGKACELAARQLTEARRPQFLFINMIEAHHPYVPQLPFAVRFAGLRRGLIDRIWVNLFWPSSKLWNLAAVGSEDTFRLLEDLYVASIAAMARVGTLLAKLEEAGVLDDSVVILCADHGESLGEHRLVSHGLSLYEPLIHIPLIMRLPGRGAGLVSEDLTQLNDVMPSLCNFCGFELPPSLQDHPNQWYDMFDGDSPGARRNAAYAEFFCGPADLAALQNANPLYDFSQLERSLRAIRTRNWKYIIGSDGSTELYDMQQDPDELENIAGQAPDIAQRLDTQLREYFDAIGAGELSLNRRTMGDAYSDHERSQVEEHLRDLGYL